jgi:hypothetical protein
MAAVRLTVGAASDGSMRTVFKPLVEAAREAAGQVKAIFKGMGSGSGDGFKDVPGAAAKATAVIEREAKRGADAEIREAKRAAQEKARAAEHVFQIKQRYLQQEEREAQRSMSKQAAEQQKHAERTGYWSMRYMDRTMRAAGGFALSMAKGAGVDLDMGRMVGKSVEMGKAAQDLSNSAYQPGEKGAAGRRVAASTIESEAMSAANKAALDPMRALEGMQAFVSTTGDLQTAREIIGELGVLSRATGTDFGDMVAASGEVSAKLGDIPNKGEAVLSVMRGLAGQGKLGAVEIRNVAKEMANVGSVAGAFQGTAQENMIIIGAMMQEARQRGGAKSAAVAANSVATFASYVTSQKGIKNLAAGGVQPWADKGHTKILNPETIILGALMKSNGDLGKLSSMFRDKMAMRSVTGFAQLYNDTKGSQTEKLDAVRNEFTRLKSAAMGQGEVEDSFNASMKTTEAQVQLFNNKLAQVGAEIAGKLLPSLIKLGPTVIAGVEAFGKFVAWAVDNPGKAVAAALVASIARAQIDTVIRAGIENLMKGGGGTGGVGGKGGGGAAGAISVIGSAVNIAAVAVTIEQVGELVIDKLMKDKEKAEEKVIDDSIKSTNAREAIRAGMDRGAVKEEDIEALKKDTAQLEQRVKDATVKERQGTGGDIYDAVVDPGQALLHYVTGGELGKSKTQIDNADADVANLDLLREQLSKNNDQADKLFNAVTTGILKVDIVKGMPGVDPKGRSK